MIDPHHCSRYTGLKDQCVHNEQCSIHDVLGGLAGYVQSFLSGTTLQDLITNANGIPLSRSGDHVEISPAALEKELSQVNGQVTAEQ
jgi:DNA-binding IscR family transcriptional regulator